MNNSNELLHTFRLVVKLCGSVLFEISCGHGLNRFEILVLDYLSSQTKGDTASDIVEGRMIPKANVSVAVDSLIQKELLVREVDKKDRRRIHLALTPKAKEIAREIRSRQELLLEELFSDIPQQQQLLIQESLLGMKEKALSKLSDIQTRHFAGAHRFGEKMVHD